MPKVPMYTLAWSAVIEAYELYETRDRRVLRIVPESLARFAWLDQMSSFAFAGKSGHFTAPLTSAWHDWSRSQICWVLTARPDSRLPKR